MKKLNETTFLTHLRNSPVRLVMSDGREENEVILLGWDKYRIFVRDQSGKVAMHYKHAIASLMSA